MPYGRRSRRNARRTNRRRTRRFLRNRSSKRQAFQLSRISRRLSSLAYKFHTRGNTFCFYNEYDRQIPQYTVTGNLYGYTTIPIHPRTTSWRPCLDQPTDAQLSMDDWYLRSTISKFRINIGDEATNPIRFNAFIIQVKPSYRDITYYNLGTELQSAFTPTVSSNNTPADAAYNPWSCSAKGQAFINRKIFRVLWAKQFTLGQVAYGNTAPNVRNIRDTVRDFTFRMNYGKYGTKLGRSQPDVEESLGISNKTVNRRCWTFLLIISNDNTADLSSGQCEMTNLHYLRTKA